MVIRPAVLDDMPFLVDSLSAYLQGLKEAGFATGLSARSSNPINLG